MKSKAKKTSRKTGFRKKPIERKPVLGHIKKGLGFNSLINEISNLFLSISDKRQQKKIKYTIRDSLMSGLAMMYFQDPSLLQFQRRMEEDSNASNLEALFGVLKIPADTQMRKIIDNVPSEKIEEIFSIFFKLLQRAKKLEDFVFLDGQYLIAIDGTQFFTSDITSCDHCLTKTSKKGEVRYHHQVLQAKQALGLHSLEATRALDSSYSSRYETGYSTSI